MSSRRKNIMLGTAGHVDHGKTALVKLLTGCETDTLAEEKQRGLTIDLGFAPCQLADDRVVGVVDVPGHVDFIRNMVAGAHGVDVVILVVAADDGIMPQTHEHLHILTLMGLRHGLVALTKVDLVDAPRRAEVIAELEHLLAPTFLAGAPICPVSNITGEGYDGFFDSLNRVVSQCAARPSEGIFRVWVEDVFTLRGPGTVVTGIPVAGAVRSGDILRVLPDGLAGRVRGMQVYGEVADQGRAGECVALNVPELNHEQIRRGMLLCGSEVVTAVSMAEAELCLLASLRGSVKDFFEAHLHVGTAFATVNVAMLEGAEMSPGQSQFVQLRLPEPIPLCPGDRFVLRANLAAQGQTGLVTAGGGRILGVSDTRLRRRKQWTIDLLRSRRDCVGEPARWCEQMLREHARPLSSAELAGFCLLRPEDLPGVLRNVRDGGSLHELPGGCFTHATVVSAAQDKMMAALEAFHAGQPQRNGMERAGLLAGSGGDSRIAEFALEGLLQARKVQQAGTVYARSGWSPRLSDQDEQLLAGTAAAVQKAGCAAPSLTDLASSLGHPSTRIQKALQILAERGTLVKIDSDMFLHRDAFLAAQQVALGLFAKKPVFTTMEFRDALNVSRKYAVPILDHFDRIRFTVRSGHDRTPGVEAKKLMTGK